MAYALLNHPKLKDYDTSSLVFVNIGGAAAGPSLMKEIEETLGGRAYSGYGMTETTPVLTLAWMLLSNSSTKRLAANDGANAEGLADGGAATPRGRVGGRAPSR